MRTIENERFPNERDLYNISDTNVINCKFTGNDLSESALKECRNIKVSNCVFDLRYPMWHDNKLIVENSKLSTSARAPFWYDFDVILENVTLLAPKAFRECKTVSINNSKIDSSEVFWNCEDVTIACSNLSSEYIFLNSKNVKMQACNFKGKYSFQYVENMVIENSNLDTKDAFWHTNNVTVKNCNIKGEYLGWYSNNLTLINCNIKGTQPLCYCKSLKIIDCNFYDADLAFENSDVEATIKTNLVSIKNPRSGFIKCKESKVIIDDSPYEKNCKIEFIK